MALALVLLLLLLLLLLVVVAVVVVVASRRRETASEIFDSHFQVNHHLCDASPHTVQQNQYQALLLLLFVVVFIVNYVRMTHHFYVIECARTFSH